MSISPDTDAIYNEAIAIEARVEQLELKRYEYRRLLRDEELALLSNGFMPDATEDTRLAACKLRADQIVDEKHSELLKLIVEEAAVIEAMRVRNEGIIAAGWAEQFALNSWSRSLRDPHAKGELTE